jgi:hypothetical protein
MQRWASHIPAEVLNVNGGSVLLATDKVLP